MISNRNYKFISYVLIIVFNAVSFEVYEEVRFLLTSS